MKKNITIIVLILSLFLLVGCNKDNKNDGSVKLHSIEELREQFKDDMDVMIVEDKAVDSSDYQKANVSKKGSGYTIYTFEKDEHAKDFYDYYLKIYSSRKNDGDTENIKEDVSYELITTDTYYYIMVDKNIMVAANCEISQKDASIDLMKLTNYHE